MFLSQEAIYSSAGWAQTYAPKREPWINPDRMAKKGTIFSPIDGYFRVVLEAVVIGLALTMIIHITKHAQDEKGFIQ